MPRTVVIGGSGHIGSYLVPNLVAAGHEVINVVRGESKPYRSSRTWESVRTEIADRTAEETAGRFGDHIASMKPDVVVDMICFTQDSAMQLAEALKGKISHLIHIGTIWVHGYSVQTPTRESDARAPFGDYGVQKSQIEDYLLGLARRGDLPATVVRPGHIVGPGWAPLNPQGHFNPDVFRTIRDGKKLAIPNFGLETVHHVHAEDVAQVVFKSIQNWGAANGEAFNAVSPAALTLRGYAEAMFAFFGHAPNIEFMPFEAWKGTVSADEAQATWEHIARSPSHSIEKAQRLLGYTPFYSSLDAVKQSVSTLLA